MSSRIDLSEAFFALTDNLPFPWQSHLYEELLTGNIRPACDIPTGLGKTSVIAIWLIALATKEQKCYLPRRLAYVVNRRTIVDQSTDVVEQIRNRVLNPENAAREEHRSALHELKNSLEQLAGTDEIPLAVSTLRGELADNEEWKQNPRCPAIIIGTVDMIGSKLLFSGYGDSRYFRPLHAGLMGCDTLFIHDEAHLTPAFGKLLSSVVKQNGGDKDCGIPPMMQVMELSATHREGNGEPFTITDEDRRCAEIKKRLNATKRLYLHEVDKPGKEVLDQILNLIREKYLNSKKTERVVVFVRSPEDAKKVAEGIKDAIKKEKSDKNGGERVAVLSGEIRGYERDLLLEKPGMKPFVSTEKSQQTVFLVATSAGEVGMDLHADQMVCDLTSLDSMIQRFGRVNRFGQTDARIDLVHEKTPKESDRQKTMEILYSKQTKDGGIDVCPAALSRLLEEGKDEEKKKELAQAFSEIPEMVALTDILVDLWAQTSLYDIPARPEVAPWLHGIQDNLPETWVAWRKEVKKGLLDNTVNDTDSLSRWFGTARIGAKEKLRMPTYRFLDFLQDKNGEPKKWVKDNANQPVVIISASGMAETKTLGRLARHKLGFATVVLPIEAGGLNENGYFDEKGGNKELDVFGITDKDHNDASERIVLTRKGNRFRFSSVGDESTWREIADDDENQPYSEWKSLSSAVKEAETACKKRLKYRIKIKDDDECRDEDEIEERWLLLLQDTGKKGKSRRMQNIPTVKEHNEDVAERIAQMAAAFGLSEKLQDALRTAALHHDLGKTAPLWQKAAGHNPDVEGFVPLAKSKSGIFNGRALNGYRHELGSVGAAALNDKISKHEERDLILHLIAAHHGWARPHFKDGALPPNQDDDKRSLIHREVMLRYVRLQERFGHWRLAWLESLLRRADGQASASYNETSPEEDNS